MSILDDAIREHLELKRAHGADESELKRLEDEAFGPPGRPDEENSFSEGPTEFLAAPATDAADAAADAAVETSGRPAPNIADLQEAPELPKAEPEAEVEDAPSEDAAPETPAPGASEAEDAAPQATGPSTEERHAIASQPTELFDVEAEIDAGSEKESPTDEELLDSQLSEPRLAPSEPGAPAEPVGEIESTGPDAEVAGERQDEDEDDFFSEQRLSDELNQALEAPVTDEHEVLPELPSEQREPYPTTDEHEVSEHQTSFESDEHEAVSELPSEEHTEVYDYGSERREEPADADTDERGYEDDEGDQQDEEPGDRRDRAAAEHEDVLEDTPDFLEDAPEDDELWFEQKPPKDFDFDD